LANLIGYLDYDHHARQIHRLAHRSITARLSTWKTHINFTLDEYGRLSGSIERDGKIIKRFHYDKGELSKKDIELCEAKRLRAQDRPSYEERIAKVDRILEGRV
jgi:hypothetical protein